MAIVNGSFSGESINSVSVAVDSASSDVGVEADLESFAYYRHNPYGSLSDMAAVMASPTSSTSAPTSASHALAPHPPVAVGTSPVTKQGAMARFPTPPPYCHNGNPYKSHENNSPVFDQLASTSGASVSNLQAMRGHFSNTSAKKKRDRKRPMRFMPPPPPSLQGARVMDVCCKRGLEYYESPDDMATESISLAARQAEIHGSRTCVAEGDFAFLTKAPGTSNWVMGGYGAYYSTTEWEGAPSATFHRLNQNSEGFQKYFKVLMKWYSRVSRQFDSNSQQIAENFEQLASTTSSLPKKYFSHSTVPPCPRPDFEVFPNKDYQYIGNIGQFLVWHDDIQEWWVRFVQPKMIGFLLHSRTTGKDEDSDYDS